MPESTAKLLDALGEPGRELASFGSRGGASVERIPPLFRSWTLSRGCRPARQGAARVRPVKRRVTAAVLGVAATAALVGPGAAGAGEGRRHPARAMSRRYLTKGKLKPDNRIEYRVVCAADCQLTATSSVVLNGPNLRPVSSTGAFVAGQVVEVFLSRTSPRGPRSGRRGSAKLVTKVSATNTLTGETDTDRRNFRFK